MSTRAQVRFCILGSGSDGNCAFLRTPSARVLIDAGFSARRTRELLAGIGESLERVDAIFITHEHGDHSDALEGMAKFGHIRVFANAPTARKVQERLNYRPSWQIFETGARFDFLDLRVESFSVPHDAQEPVGFVFTHVPGSMECGDLSPLLTAGLVTPPLRASHTPACSDGGPTSRPVKSGDKSPHSITEASESTGGHPVVPAATRQPSSRQPSSLQPSGLQNFRTSELSAHSVAWLTDLGYIPQHVHERIRHAEVLVVEANHCSEMLMADTRRPWSTKQRISSRHGHLSNQAVRALLEAAAAENPAWRQIYLTHLSRDCNSVDAIMRAFAGIEATLKCPFAVVPPGACSAFYEFAP